MPHSIVSDDFNSSEKIMLKDQTYKFTFDEAGDYTYNCGIHSDMQGKIKVLSAEEYGLKGISDEKEENKTKSSCMSIYVCLDLLTREEILEKVFFFIFNLVRDLITVQDY